MEKQSNKYLQKNIINANETENSLIEIFQNNSINIIKSFFGIEKKEASTETTLITENEKNNNLYILLANTQLILEKSGEKFETTIKEETIIGEENLLKYLENKLPAPASFTIKIIGKYYQLSFNDFKENLQNIPDKKNYLVRRYLQYLKYIRNLDIKKFL